MERVVDPMAPVATTPRVGSQSIAFAVMLATYLAGLGIGAAILAVWQPIQTKRETRGV